jgi:hypothetical protein
MMGEPSFPSSNLPLPAKQSTIFKGLCVASNFAQYGFK